MTADLHTYGLWYDATVDDGYISADASDYWYLGLDHVFEGCLLVRLDHPFITTTGRRMHGPRVLKHNPTYRDLVRLRERCRP